MADIDVEVELAQLIAAKASADTALAAFEQGVVAEHVAAKAAHRANPTEETRAAKSVTAARVRAVREATRAGRVGTQVAGDAVAETES